MKLRAMLLLLCLPIAMAGCATAPQVTLPAESSPSDPKVVQLLYEQYNNWRGVRYRDGGMSRNGVDCSGFVYVTFKEQFNRRVPRTTELLATSGLQVNARQARAGDLVFFKTGWNKRHVGIYLKNGSFMHASTSRGVMISKLHNPYWADAFWMVRRLDSSGS